MKYYIYVVSYSYHIFFISLSLCTRSPLYFLCCVPNLSLPHEHEYFLYNNKVTEVRMELNYLKCFANVKYKILENTKCWKYLKVTK